MRLSLISAGKFLARASQREKYSGRLVSGGDEGTNPVSSEMSKSCKCSSVLISVHAPSLASFPGPAQPGNESTRPLAPRPKWYRSGNETIISLWKPDSRLRGRAEREGTC